MWTIGATLDPRDPVTPGEGGSRIDVIAPPLGELFSETNDNSVATFLTNATTRVHLVRDAEAREEHMASGQCTRP